MDLLLKRVTTEQVKAARMLLTWDQNRLAAAAGVAPITIKRIEAVTGPMKTTSKTAALICTAFEKEGITFVTSESQTKIGVILSRES